MTASWRGIWLERVLYALMTGALAACVAMMLYAVALFYFNDPPIDLHSLDAPNLGALCPGTDASAHLAVNVHKAIIMHYYLSVLREDTTNVLGTQRAYTDILHPWPASFDMVLPWEVPELLPGNYNRVVAARNVMGAQNTVFVINSFAVPEKCT